MTPYALERRKKKREVEGICHYDAYNVLLCPNSRIFLPIKMTQRSREYKRESMKGYHFQNFNQQQSMITTLEH